MRKICLILILLGLNFSLAEAEILKIDDFDRCQKPSLISGDYGSWNRTEWDRSQYCNESYTSNPHIVYGGKGCSLQLDYDVDSPNPAYNGFWMRLEKINLNNYRNFVFFVKGDEKKGYTTRFKVELKSMKGDIARYEVEGINSEWKKVVLPLGPALKEGDFSEAFEFTIVFDDQFVTQKKGRIYLDNIYLTN